MQYLSILSWLHILTLSRGTASLLQGRGLYHPLLAHWLSAILTCRIISTAEATPTSACASHLTDMLFLNSQILISYRISSRFIDIVMSSWYLVCNLIHVPSNSYYGITLHRHSLSFIGHVNFSDEVTAAYRLADGVVIVVDASEGVSSARQQQYTAALSVYNIGDAEY